MATARLPSTRRAWLVHSFSRCVRHRVPRCIDERQVLSDAKLADAEVVARARKLVALARLASKDADVIAHEAALVLVQRYGIQISLLSDDAVVLLAQAAFMRAVQHMAATAHQWDVPTLPLFTNGARLGRSRDWTQPWSTTKVQAGSHTWVAEEMLGRSAICHGGELLHDTDDAADVDQFGPMLLEDATDHAVFFGDSIPDASFLGEAWAMKMLEVSHMVKALPVAPTAAKKKKIEDESPENTDKRLFGLVKVVDAELVPLFNRDARKAGRDVRQSQQRLSVDVRHSVRASFVQDRENHNLPPKNGHFQDRAVCLADIKKHLSGSSRVVITGPSGAGKSQAALYFAHTALAVRKYHLIFRIECQTVTQVELGYRALADFFNMDVSSISLTQIINKVHMRLSNDPALFDFLLIYDDVPSEDQLLAFIPGGFPERKGKYDSHIILTSVGSHWTRTARIQLAGYTESEAGVHLFRQLPNTSKQDRELLAAKLQFHPLSIAQAVGFLKHSNTSIADFIQMFEALHKPVAGAADPLAAIARATTIIMFNELEKRVSVAVAIADHMAFLSPASIKEEIIMAVLRSRGADQMLDPGILLCETVALISRTGNEGSASFQMHDGVRETRAGTIDKGDADAIMGTWMNILTSVYDRSQPSTKDLMKQRELLLPHAEYILQHWQNMHDKPARGMPADAADTWLQSATVLFNVAQTCQDLCIFDQALLFTDTVLRIRRELLDGKHESVVEVTEMQAAVFKAQGNLDKAATLYEEAYAILSNAHGADYAGLATSIQGLADVYLKQGQFKQAQSGYETALKLRTKALGSRHELVAESMEGLAKALLGGGNSGSKPTGMMEEVLAIRRSVLGPEHPLVADALIGLASLNEASDDIGQALERYDQAIKIFEKNFCKDHFKIFAASLAVANIYQLSDPDRALRYLQTLLKLRRTV